MKSQISSLDLHYLLKEMKILEDGRVDKIYHPKKEELLIQFHISGKGKQMLRIISGKFIFLTEYKERYDEPSGFCMFLRKQLSNARLRDISQAGSERICKLIFETKEGKYNMYVELFGKGNIIFTDSNDIILNALEQKKWADREIKKGVKYKYPRKEFNFFRITKEELAGILASDRELVYKLAKDIGLGGTYSEEICKLAGIDKHKKKLSREEAEIVFQAFKKILHKQAKPGIVYKDGKIKDIVPFEIEIFKGFSATDSDSLSNAFDNLFKEEYAEKEEFKSKHQGMIDRAKKIIEQQNSQIENLEKKAEENKAKGELIYSKYGLVQEILREINEARKKYSFEEIKQRLKGHRLIKEIDEKNKKIVVKL